MFDSDGESYYRLRFLISRYKERETYPWEQLKESAEQTTDVVRDVVVNLVEQYDRIGDEELKTVFRLCQNPSDGLSAEEKRDRIRELDFPEAVIERITAKIDDTVGSVGAAMQEPTLHVGGEEEHVEAERALHDCFGRIVQQYDSESELIRAVQDLIEIEFYQVQSGRMSPILHYLVPDVFPVINGRSSKGMESLINETVSVKLSDYLNERERYIEVQNEFEFNPHLRELDYFLHWVQEDDTLWTEARRKGINRTVWQAQPGPTGDSAPEELWPIWTERDLASVGWIGEVNKPEDELSGQTAHFVSRMSPGDIVVAKRGFHELLGLGVVTPAGHQYVGDTDQEIIFADGNEAHPNIRPVEWVFTRSTADAIDTEQWDMSKQFGQKAIVKYNCYEELRWQLLANHHDEVLSALESLESWSIDYATGQYDPDEYTNGGAETDTGISDEEIPDAPAQASEIERQLLEKKQVVFYGPPGTGKTYTAERFAKWWVGQQDSSDTVSDRVSTVTFHPSFTYEDFIEGLSAKTGDDGQVAYEVQDGALKRMQAAAMAAYERAVEAGTEPNRYVLIIDEINRGNLAQIFGEVITLLETDKRGSFDVELAHSGETFTLPPNLYVIGTMNTADQSIALVDTALRRRFRFMDFPPDLDVVWEIDNMVAADPRSAVTQANEDVSPREQLLGASVLAVETLNERILDAPELGKGKQLGHTYLLGHDSPTDIVDAWRYDILPQLEEYYFGQFDQLQEYLLAETGERLVQKKTEQIQSFNAADLYTALCLVAGIDDPVPLAEIEVRAVADGAIEAKDLWATGQKDLEGFRDRIDQTLNQASINRVERLFSVGEELGEIGTGEGEYYASAQLKTGLVDENLGLIDIKQDGKVRFKLDWLPERESNDLTVEFIAEAARVFEEADAYNHELHPDDDDKGPLVIPDLQIADLSDDEVDLLAEGYKKFAQQAYEFQHG